MQEDKDIEEEEKWKQACKDAVERTKRMGLLAMLSLEEAMTHVNVPVYGLTQEMCGLRHRMHVSSSENDMRLEYYSPRYKQHEMAKGLTFVVESRLYENVIPGERGERCRQH